jgi:hypothetical protein
MTIARFLPLQVIPTSHMLRSIFSTYLLKLSVAFILLPH